MSIERHGTTRRYSDVVARGDFLAEKIDMIGVFDSGIGGLSVLAAIARVLPRSDLSYLADMAHVPYGNKNDAYIRERVLHIGRYLVEQQKCLPLVVACNTATAAAVAALRESLPHIDVVGVEPGVKPAAAASKSGHIAVLSTESTARSERLARLIQRHAGPVRVDILPCPGWATKVESLQLDEPDFAETARRLLEPVLAVGADHIVLGCTHYAFLAPVLEPIVAGRAALVDVADAVARQCQRLVGVEDAGGRRSLTLLATAHPERLSRALNVLGQESLAARLTGPAILVNV